MRPSAERHTHHHTPPSRGSASPMPASTPVRHPTSACHLPASAAETCHSRCSAARFAPCAPPQSGVTRGGRFVYHPAGFCSACTRNPARQSLLLSCSRPAPIRPTHTHPSHAHRRPAVGSLCMCMLSRVLWSTAQALNTHCEPLRSVADASSVPSTYNAAAARVRVPRVCVIWPFWLRGCTRGYMKFAE